MKKYFLFLLSFFAINYQFASTSDHINLNDEKIAQAFAKAPAILNTLIKDIKNEKEYTKKYQYLLLAGSAQDRALLAQAIAQTLGLQCVKINTREIMSHNPLVTKEKLKDTFQYAQSLYGKSLLIIEDLELVLDGKKNGSESNIIALQLCALLDEIKENRSIIFIGTSGVTKTLHPNLQSRFKGKTFEVQDTVNVS